MRLVLQAESAECGLACLAMVLSFHGKNVELSALRRECPASLKGARLSDLISAGAKFSLSARPLRLELDELAKLPPATILHWNFNHFVVLKAVSSRHVTILDPGIGERKLTLEEASRQFTGVALELTPTAEFTKAEQTQRVSVGMLTGRVAGLKRSLVYIFLVALSLQLFALAGPLINQIILDDILASGDRDLLKLVIFGFALLTITQTLLGLARSWMVMTLSQNVSIQWMANLFSHLLRLPTGYFEKRHLGDISSRFSSIRTIQHTLTTSFVEVALDGIMGVVALGMMLAYSWHLTLIALTALAIYGIVRWVSYAPLRDASAERMIISARENSAFLETLRAVQPIKLFGKTAERCARWKNLVVEAQNRDIQTIKLGIWYSTANTFIFSFENLAVLWIGASTIIEGKTASTTSTSLTAGMLFAYLAYKSQFMSRITGLISFAFEIKMLSLHGERLADIALEEAEPHDPSLRDLSYLEADIEFQSVDFKYSAGESLVLSQVNFKISNRERVAITGPSGAGKTTLAKVLLGLAKPTSGKVLYGGISIDQLGVESFRKCVATVMQEDQLLSGTIGENICFFDETPDQQFIEECAKRSSIHSDIQAMPMGYLTLVGDLGTGLSGGQKQRILLARALYKRPKVLLLDEATSSLDVRNERAVTDEINALGVTCITIAHRPETIARADRVLFVFGGKAKEVSKDDLVKLGLIPRAQPLAQQGVSISLV